MSFIRTASVSNVGEGWSRCLNNGVEGASARLTLSDAFNLFSSVDRNFLITHGNAPAIAALRMRVGSGGMALVIDTRSSKYSQKETPSLRQVFFRLAQETRH